MGAMAGIGATTHYQAYGLNTNWTVDGDSTDNTPITYGSVLKVVVYADFNSVFTKGKRD